MVQLDPEGAVASEVARSCESESSDRRHGHARRVLLAELRKTQPSAAAGSTASLRPKHRIRKLERPRKSSRTGPHAVTEPDTDL